ncbi:hypothetical protein GF318_04560 [Candidatus Micrarchaeota archaeon]|nr:hypothetical protein [Candidatus Micrarchaeota archaeon]
MFVSFELLLLLFWIFVSAFIPGAILSFGILRKQDFLWLEKLLIGFALGIVLLALIPFLMYFLAGVKFSYMVAVVSVALLYLISIAVFVWKKAYEGLKLPEMPKLGAENITVTKEAAVSFFLLLILVVSFMLRVGTYSPVFQELDPYYYTYIAQQLLVFGENPFDDQTAWYPELEVEHRQVPALSYLEAVWYSLYNGGTEYDNMLLAVLASMYPPVAAVLAVFFIYLFVSVVTKREWGLVSAGLATSVPIFIMKLSAGEQEIQPYAFFSLTFFFAMYALTLKRKGGLLFPALAGLGFAAVALGSGSQVLAMISAMLFMVVQSIALYLRDEDESGLFSLLKSNAVIFLIGPFLGSFILRDWFRRGWFTMDFTIVAPYFLALAFVGLLYILKKKLPDFQKASLALAAVLLVGMVALAATPLGEYATKSAKRAFGIAEFRFPLQRTIAEQNLAPSNLGSTMGFVAQTYDVVFATLLTPVTAILRLGSEGAAAGLEDGLGWIFSQLFLIVTVPVNLALALFVGIVNLVLGTNVQFVDKANSLLLLWVLAFWVAAAYALYRFVKYKENNLSLLMLTFIMPAFVVGIIKAKYTVYAAVLLSVAIGFSLGTLGGPLSEILKGEKTREAVGRALLVVGTALVVIQFAFGGFAPSLLWGSAIPLYQNDPAELAPKFQQFCDVSNDSVVCAAAEDPTGYAEQGTNYQYNRKLCELSILSDYSHYSKRGKAPFWEASVASFRCQRIAPYWIETMEWIRHNTENDSRTTSWWDYGHWINFFGQKNAVLRNEHRSKTMIGAVADGYLDATPEELKDWMKEHDSEYALLDMELIMSGASLGGKYGALNYLSCAHNNETTVERGTMKSDCEAEHLWETIFISSQPCTISKTGNKTGNLAYKVYEDVYQEKNGEAEFLGTFYRHYYPPGCVNPKDANTVSYCRNAVHMEPAYCVGNVLLATNETIPGTYYLNQTYPTGDLKLNKAMLQLPLQYHTSHLGPVTAATLFYTNEPIWIENGVIKSGYEDRKGEFYDSNLYKGLFLNSIPGFELAFTSSGGAVKIYKIAD